jgi:RNA polymerase sigma factor (sigma-70 family)
VERKRALAPLTEEQRRLILENMGYAENVAKVAARALPLAEVGMSVDDCVQLGLLGLTQAARRFDASDHDPARATVATRFRSFAYLRIRGAVVDECRRLGGERRRLPPPTLSLDHDGGESLGAAADAGLDEAIDTRAALDSLGEPDRSIAVLVAAGVPYTELAPALGVTEQRLYQIMRGVRARLAEKAGTAAA